MTEKSTLQRLPVVAIVGRMNVGKSTLFNKLTEDDRAITSSWAGTTRDVNSGVVLWRGMEFELQDTGGLDVEDDAQLEERVIAAAVRAATEADLVLFVIDGKTGVLPADEKIAKILKQTGARVMLVMNKVDRESTTEFDSSIYKFGLGEPVLVSSKNGRGSGDLLDSIFETLEVNTTPQIIDPRIKVAIIGRPNVGKSSLLNSILGEDRVIVADMAHTTRDTNDIPYTYNGKDYLLIDTAGIRKRKNVSSGWSDKRLGIIERQSVSHAIHAINRADVVILVMEAQKRMSSQDKKIADMAVENGKGLIMVLNKWDLIEEKTPTTINEFADYFHAELPSLRWAPMVFVSAKETLRVRELLNLVSTVADNYSREVDEDTLAEVFAVAQRMYHPKQTAMRKYKKRDAKLKGLTQIGVKPPRFLFSAKYPKDVPKAIINIIERELRTQCDFAGVQIIIEVA